MNKNEKRERQAQAEAAFKTFTKEIRNVGHDEDPEILQSKIKEHFKKCEDLYPLVMKRLPGSAADAKHIKYLTNLCKDAAIRINTISKKFDLKRAITSVKRDHMDFFETIQDCFRTPPTFEFFYGAIKDEGLELKQRKKRSRIQTEESQTVSATEKMTLDCEQDSTPREVEEIAAKIKDLSGSPFIYLVDAKSFTKTVENIFHTSFLVKEGRVGIKGSGDQPVVTFEEDIHITQPRKQSILSFSKADFNRWKQKYNRH